MLQGAIVNQPPIKSISAARPPKPGPHTRAKERRGGANVIWHRITESFDRDVKKFGANPALVAPITRWALFNHLTPTQAMAGRRYGDIVGKYRRFCSEGGSPSPRSAALEPVRAPEEDEVERHIARGSIADYEDKARKAKSQYKRLMKVLARYADPVTGRNFAKDQLDTLCLEEREPDARYREDIARVLGAVAKEFSIGERRRKITGGKV